MRTTGESLVSRVLQHIWMRRNTPTNMRRNMLRRPSLQKVRDQDLETSQMIKLEEMETKHPVEVELEMEVEVEQEVELELEAELEVEMVRQQPLVKYHQRLEILSQTHHILLLVVKDHQFRLNFRLQQLHQPQLPLLLLQLQPVQDHQS